MNDEENEIDNLLKALDGIEQCFVTDFHQDTELELVEVEERSPTSIKILPSVSSHKRPVDASLSSATPSKRINLNLKDPRLRKFGAGSTSSAPPVKENNNIPVPKFNLLDSKNLTGAGNLVNPLSVSTHVIDHTKKTPLELSINDSRKIEKFQSDEKTSRLSFNKSTPTPPSEVLKLVQKSNPRSVEPTLKRRALSYTPEKSVNFILTTPVTERNSKKVVSWGDEKFKMQESVSNVDESLNKPKKSQVETIPFRKPEKISNLPIRRPVKSSYELSRNSRPLLNKDLINKKPQNLSHKKPSTIHKSKVFAPNKNFNFGEVPNPLVKNPSVSSKSLGVFDNSGRSVSTAVSAPTNKCNEGKIDEAIPEKTIFLEKPYEKNKPIGKLKESISVSSEENNGPEELDPRKNKTGSSISKNSVQTVKSSNKKSENEPTKRCKIYEADSLLPIEILVKIFKYLSVRDRRNVKLVCKCWYDTCSMKLFMMRQRFVCCGNYDTTSILQTLIRSRCEYFNVEFYRVNFFDHFNEYWKVLGPKIHSLYFVDCVIGEETFGDVIIHCTDMEHLSFSFEYLKVPSLKLFTLALFENLYKQRIERRKLVSFDLQINSNGWFSNAIISNLFAIFPNISRLGFTCHSLDPIENEIEAVPPCDIAFSDLWSSKTLTFSPILKCITSPPDSMEKLMLNLHTKERRTGFAWQSIVTYSKLTRLREITMEIDLKKLSGNAVIEFCCNQKELKRMSCRIVGSAKLFISLFLMKLLDNCPRLRNLDVTYNAPFLISYELFRGLISSKLKSLSLESPNVLLAPQIVDESTWPINEHLKSLSLSHGIGKNLQNLFIVIFCNLKFLEVHNLSDDILQLIWKFQTNLVGLKLAGVEECTIDGFCGVPENTSFSICNLQNLEYLVLEAVNEWQIYGNVFSEFRFPKLRYFCVDIEGSITLYKDLIEAIKRCNELEAVSINCSGVERSTWLELNKGWKKLRYLRFVDKESDRFKVNQYLNFFKISPNLRALVHEFKSSTESYYYDVFDKKIKKKIYRAKYRISSEKVGSSFIDWLWF